MKETRAVMGMPVCVNIVDTDVSKEKIAQGIELAFSYFSYVDENFSVFKDTSEISKINRGEVEPKDFSTDMKEVFALSEKTKKESEGFFNIVRPDGKINPSGLVKGWAIQRVADLLKKEGFKNFFVDAGGDIQVAGKNEKGETWKVGIKNPFNTEEIVKTVYLDDLGIATSGTYLRGQHIYNPVGGEEKIHDIVSFTVVGPNVFEADRFATSAFAMGESGIYFIENLPGLEGYMIKSDGTAIMTTGFDKLTKINMLNFVDKFLNKITMYRVVLYYLTMLIFVGMVCGFFGFVPYSPLSIFASAIIIVALCVAFNTIFSWAFDAQTNVESVYITALILACLITPIQSFSDTAFLVIAFWGSGWAMASKYLFTIGKKHLFNPAAIAVVITAFLVGQSASWWVGTASMLPFVVIGGLLVVRKVGRFDLILGFFATALVSIGLSRYSGNASFITATIQSLSYSPIFFFAFTMLSEPLTTPSTRPMRILYGAFTGLLFAPSFHIGSVYSTPELALVVGNIFSYIVGPKDKLLLSLKEYTQVANDTYHFMFRKDQKFSFEPGQYIEWTLGHSPTDSRGNRRYFTISSSPTENDVSIGVKFYQNPSTFKKKLLSLKPEDKIVAAQLSGDFTLPSDAQKKLVFVAGGIGITPYRSMLKYLIDTKQKRDIVVMYSNRSIGDIAYKEILDEAGEKCGVKTVYTLTDPIPEHIVWSGKKVMIDASMIQSEIPDWRDRKFYVSGPHAMVSGTEKTLRAMGVKGSNIKTDFFPGFV